MAPSIKKVVCIASLLLQFLVLLFVTVATPIDVLRGPATLLRVCYSMWGLKHCGNHSVNTVGEPFKGFPCRRVRDTMTAAASFAIASIFFAFVGLIMMIVRAFGCFRIPSIFTFVICAIAFFTILVSCACIAAAQTQQCDDGESLSETRLYGGFGLLVTAGCLELIICILTCVGRVAG